MRIAYFFQYYHNPDYASNGRHFAFLQHLAKRHEVHLITTDACFQQRVTDLYEWVPSNVQVDMLQVPYANHMTVRQRSVAFARYALGGLFKGITSQRPDVVFGTSTPLSAAWAAAQLARWHRAPFVFEVRDLWPDFPVEMGVLRHRYLQRLAYRMERRLYEQARHIVALSPDMADHVVRQGKPDQEVSTLIHGTDFQLRDDSLEQTPPDQLRSELGLEGKKVLLYAGTFGRANNIPTLIELAERLQHREDIVFLFTGYGYYEEALKAAAARLPNVRILPAQPRHRIFSFFSLASLSLVSFRDLPVLASNSPAKLFDSLGCGTPVVVTNEGWTKRFVQTHACGWYTPPRPAPWAALIERLLADDEALKAAGHRGRQLAQAHFDRTQLAVRFEEVLVAAAERRSTSPAPSPDPLFTQLRTPLDLETVLY